MKKVYISGRISDLPREQYMTMFGIAEQMLRKKGYKVVNPTRVWVCRWEWLWKILAWGTSEHTAYTLTLLYDLWLLMRCDLIYKLPGWQQSRGANIESCVAYHYKIWPMAKDIVQKIDKRMEKIITKNEKQ